MWVHCSALLKMTGFYAFQQQPLTRFLLYFECEKVIRFIIILFISIYKKFSSSAKNFEQCCETFFVLIVCQQKWTILIQTKIKTKDWNASSVALVVV